MLLKSLPVEEAIDIKPKISIVLAVRNEATYLDRTLEAINQQATPKHWVEVLIVDGNSSDCTLDIAKRHSQEIGSMRIFPNPRILSAAGWNIGIIESQAPLVLLLSGHVIIPPNYINTLLHEMSPGISGIGVKANPIGISGKSTLIASAFSSRFGNGGASYMTTKTSCEVDSLAYGCYWRQELLDIGGFDESIVRGQDWDLNLRLRSNGKTLWLQEGLETHYFTRANYRDLWNRQFLAGRWKRYIHEKSSKPFLARHWIPSAFVLAVLMTAVASIVWTPSIYLFTSILLAHLTASLIQLKSLNLSWRSAIPFWWALLLIHVGYGTGMISAFISPVKPRQESSTS